MMVHILGDSSSSLGDWGITHLGIELIDATNSLFDSAVLDSLAYLYTLLYQLVVDIVRKASLACEFDGSFGKTLDEEVLEDQGVQIAKTG